MQGVRIAVRASVWTIIFVGLVGFLQAFLPSARAMALDANIVMTANSPQRSDYNPAENITTGVSLDAGPMPKGKGYDGAYLEVEMPTMRYGEYTQPGKRNVWPETVDQGHLIDSGDNGFSAPVGGNIASRSAREENGKTYIRINFKRIDATVRASFPYVFSFADRVTPRDTTLQPIYRLYSADGELLAEARDKVYRATYDEYRFDKRNLRRDKAQYREVYAGAVTGDRVADDSKELVPFYFIVEPSNNRLRLVQKAKITDVLPTYTNSKGQTVRAVFDPAQNPGWVDNHDGTVSYEYQTDIAGFGYANTNVFDKTLTFINQNAILKLSFPGIQTHENGRQKEYSNTAKIELTPINKGDNEPPMVYENSVNYRIKKQMADSSGLFNKAPSDNVRGGIAHDNNSMALKEYSWALEVRNDTIHPMRHIVFTEQDGLDPRLFMSSVSYGFFERYPGGLKIVTGIWLRAYKPDGSYDDIKGNPKDSYNSRLQVNSEATTTISDNDTRIIHGDLKQKDAPDANPKYTKIEVHLPDDYELPAGNTLDFSIGTRFKNPFTVPFEVGKPVVNRAKAAATIMSESPRDVSTDVSAQAVFVKQQERVAFRKNCGVSPNATVGTRFNCEIVVDFRQASRARFYKNPKVVDLLPENIAVVDNSNHAIEPSEQNMGFVRGDIQPVKREVIKNYKGTGRTALVWEFPSGRLPESLSIASLGAFNVVKRSIPTQAQDIDNNNDNDAYFTYENDDPSGFPEELQSDQKSKDVLDVNNNSKTDDTVLHVAAKIPAVLPQEVRSQKQIRSTEQGASSAGQQNAWLSNARTNFALKDEGTFEYRLKISNFTTTGLTGLILYDVLPHKGDANGSQFSANMTGPAKVSISGKDVSADYDVYYRTDKYPSNDPVKEKDDPRWTTVYPKDGAVTAIKVLPKQGKQVPSYKIVNVDLPMVAPAIDRGLSGASSHNMFFVSYNGGKSFGGSNDVVHQLAEAVDFSGTKEWDDGNDADGVRPKEVTLKLFANGSEIKRLKATAEGKWRYDFGVLPKKDHGRDIDYRVEEDPVPGYQADIQGTTITNRHTPEKLTVQGEKKWEDDDNRDGLRPAKVTVHLLANGTRIRQVDTDGPAKWKYSFADLPKKDHGRDIDYRVEEDPVPGYQADIQGTTITNRHTPEKLTVQGEKKWEDDDNRDLAATGDDAYLFAGGGLMSVAAAIALLVIRARRRSA